ncbi:phenolic acid decarboxylase [Caulobacter ginsengisoli]|uniref:Phenolic acid decarboxylase n=1 Tax=Caulobacter ginsengisoli TaxID=400775 RepID=A0ABU0IVE3_9CAUL|nr:hypothetical protein [Caulobacter ginsengisoli]MDQ0465985.1 phenolic acid decarboxylase [Caulobacter ginsengisoli]
MWKPIALLLALTLAPGVAMAAAAPNVSAAFGNTIFSTYPDGRHGRLWLKADGSYDYRGRRNTPSSGRWHIKGDKVCLRQSRPKAIPFTYCTTAPTGGVGATWKAKAVTGEAITVTLVKGIAPLR